MQKSKKTVSGMFRPFEGLKALLEDRSIQLASESKLSTPTCGGKIKGEVVVKADFENDAALFMAAMSDVKPIGKNKHVNKKSFPKKVQRRTDDAEIVHRLDRLIEEGEGFVVEDTPEYIEGRGYNVSSRVIKRLHRGDFSVQSYIDLHGLTVEQAYEKVTEFLKESLINGKRMVLIIHGRGLSSAGKPILKTKVQEWLTYGFFRKWVIAFSSARPCDGGAGATYVLLRRHPFTKRLRKKSPVL